MAERLPGYFLAISPANRDDIIENMFTLIYLHINSIVLHKNKMGNNHRPHYTTIIFFTIHDGSLHSSTSSNT